MPAPLARTPSMQSLLLDLRFNGQHLAHATGFVVASTAGPHLITCRHVVTGRDQDTNQPLAKDTGGIPNEVRILHHSLDSPRDGVLWGWVERIEPLYDGVTPRWREHPTLGARADIVALPLMARDVQFFPYDLSADSKLELGPGDPVSVIGFPFGRAAGGFLGIWATGFIASETFVDWNDLPIQLIDSRTRQGQSGAPVVAYRAQGSTVMIDGVPKRIEEGAISQFLGVYSGRITDQSDVGMVWKAEAVRALIDKPVHSGSSTSQDSNR